MRGWPLLFALAACRLEFDPLPCPFETEGEGTIETPYRVCNPDHVATAITQSLDSYILLTGDVDFANTVFAGIGSTEAPFTGRIDGNGKTIRNITVVAAEGQPGGFINAAVGVRIENVTLENVTIVGDQYVGGLFGWCDRAQVRGVTLKNVTVSGRSNVGGIVGEATECQVFHANVDARVEGTEEAIGGIVGVAGASAFINIEGTVVVDAPLASAVGGIVGQDVWNPTTIQNAVVHADVTGDEAVGGLVGENDDGTTILRSQMTGAVRGRWGVGGFAGANYDSPFHVYATSVEMDVTGTEAVGGFSGAHWYRTKFYDSYFRGALHGTGAAQSSFGGFFGNVYYYGWVERSYVDVTIDSAASTVGGFMGKIEYWSSNAAVYDIARSVAVANITGSSATATVSPWVGENVDPNPFTGAGSVYWGGAACTNLGGGGCGTGGTNVANLAQLQSPSGPPLSSWDFTTVGHGQTGAIPSLRLDQPTTPSLAQACPTFAIVGQHYACNLEVTDTDVNEVRLPILDPSHSCGWIAGQLRDFGNVGGLSAQVHGTPDAMHEGSCVLAFTVTDGVNEGSIETMTVQVHRGVTIAPNQNPWENAPTVWFMGTNPGTPLIVEVTLTNQELIPVTGLGIGGLPANGFRYAGGTFPGTGGTCATTLASNAACTLAIEFAPTVSGPYSQTVQVQFTAARGPVSYDVMFTGHGY